MDGATVSPGVGVQANLEGAVTLVTPGAARACGGLARRLRIDPLGASRRPKGGPPGGLRSAGVLRSEP